RDKTDMDSKGKQDREEAVHFPGMCEDFRKKRDHNSLSFEPCYAKRIRAHLSDNSNFVESASSGA
ncbi:hypothetical protein J1N35_022279, partial [Gossypium stocksii]